MGNQTTTREIFWDLKAPSINYSICTMVTHKIEYNAMTRQFLDFRFDGLDCEFFYIDNIKRNEHSSFA